MNGRKNFKTLLVMAVILLGFGCTIAAGEVIYVDYDADPCGDGLSWGTAYKYLQDALYKPPAGGDEIWVAAGTYYPDEDEAANVDPNDRTETFQLINGVAIYGGFAGGETSLDERDWQNNETILSGDINKPGSSDNSYHVVTGSGTVLTAILDGFTITAGNANEGTFPDPTCTGGGLFNVFSSSPTVTNCTFSSNSADLGGGMYNWNSSPTLTNCTFSGNWANDYGGGMSNNGGSPTLTNCAFSGNSSGSGGGGMSNNGGSPTLTNCAFSGNSTGFGGGMYNEASSPTLTNCTFRGNSADSEGGGMYNSWESPTLTNCTFSGNLAGAYGGGMCNWWNSPTLTNCTFSGNVAANYSGGGMVNLQWSSPTVTNCTFSWNSAEDTGGGMANFESNPTLTNCILWGDTAPTGSEIYNDGPSSATVNYSDIQGGWSGMGNKNADPLFFDPDGDDNIAGTEDDNLRLLSYSPCIDAGDNTAVPIDITADLDGSSRFFDDINVPDTGFGDPPLVDMGAYERNIPSGGGFCGDVYHPYPVMDFNHDCIVDFYDFAAFCSHWLECTKPECD